MRHVYVFQVEDISSMLNITSQLNTDGKTRAYYFRIEPSTSVMPISKDVKTIILSFIAGPFSRILTIRIKGKIIQCFVIMCYKYYGTRGAKIRNFNLQIIWCLYFQIFLLTKRK